MDDNRFFKSFNLGSNLDSNICLMASGTRPVRTPARSRCGTFCIIKRLGLSEQPSRAPRQLTRSARLPPREASARVRCRHRLPSTFLFNRLAQRSDGFDTVASIKTGGVNLMFEPGSSWQPFGTCQSAFTLQEFLVHHTELRAGQGRASMIAGFGVYLFVFFGTVRKCLHCVLERGKGQVQRDVSHRRRNKALLWLGRRAEGPLVDLSITLVGFLLFVLLEFLELIHLSPDHLGKVVEVVSQQPRTRKPHHRSPRCLSKCLAINKVYVRKASVPVKIVIGRVVDAAAVTTALLTIWPLTTSIMRAARTTVICCASAVRAYRSTRIRRLAKRTNCTCLFITLSSGNQF